MIRYLIAFNVLALYVIYLGGKVDPHPLQPMRDAFDYAGVALAGVNTLVAIFAILRWRELGKWWSKHPGKSPAQRRVLDEIGCGNHSPIMAKAAASAITAITDDGRVKG